MDVLTFSIAGAIPLMVVHLTGGGKPSRDMVNMDYWKFNKY